MLRYLVRMVREGVGLLTGSGPGFGGGRRRKERKKRLAELPMSVARSTAHAHAASINWIWKRGRMATTLLDEGEGGGTEEQGLVGITQNLN